MKKITMILLSVLSACVLGACSSQTNDPASASQVVETEEETSGAKTEEEAKKDQEQEESQETKSAETESGQEAKVLVAYFSCTNTTRPLAEYAADALGADLYEIVAATPYTEEDFNYGNSDCRANQEQKNPDSRPEISGSVEGMEEYDILFLGYPNMEQGFESVLCV